MRLENVGNKFKERLQVVGGSHFFGQVLDMPDTSRVSNFLSARRFLRTAPNSPISPTDVIQVGSDQFIVAEHGTGRYKDAIYKHFKLFEVDEVITWSRDTKYKDPVTGVEKKYSDLSLGNIYVSIQPLSNSEDAIIKLQQGRHLLVTNAAVEVDHKLNNAEWIVTKVDPVLGVYLVEVKEA